MPIKQETLERAVKIFETMGTIDPAMHVVLKGHLLVEECLVRIIERFVFHPEQLESARLSFTQRVAIARSMSLDEHNNQMWELIQAINTLRNELAHVLESPKRVTRTERVITLLRELCSETPYDREKYDEHLGLTFAVALCLGFLQSFEEEVKRYRDVVDELDKVMNPHRYGKV